MQKGIPKPNPMIFMILKTVEVAPSLRQCSPLFSASYVDHYVHSVYYCRHTINRVWLLTLWRSSDEVVTILSIQQKSSKILNFNENQWISMKINDFQWFSWFCWVAIHSMICAWSLIVMDLRIMHDVESLINLESPDQSYQSKPMKILSKSKLFDLVYLSA